MQFFQGITGADAQNSSRPKTTSGTDKSVDKKKKNVFGLDFEIPDELQQLIVMEMKQKEKKNQQQRLTSAQGSHKQQQNNSKTTNSPHGVNLNKSDFLSDKQPARNYQFQEYGN